MEPTYKRLQRLLDFLKLVGADRVSPGSYIGVCPADSNHRLNIKCSRSHFFAACESGCKDIWQHFNQYGFTENDNIYCADAKETCSLQASEFIDAGICVIPLLCDGTKKPATYWTPFKDQLPTKLQLDYWCRSIVGFGIVCGAVSGGLEVLDFDDDAAETFAAWQKKTGDISCRLPVVETPKSGYHVYYRCTEITGNKKIAFGESDKVRIESRGQNGYVVSTFSRPDVHALNYPYVQVAGPVLPEIPLITPEERKQLWLAASEFDVRETRKKAIEAAKRRAVTRRPRSDNQGDIAERARKYVAKMDPAISGQNGHNATFSVACKLAIGFGLDWDDALPILQEFNDRCEPPWSDNELHHKLNSAYDTPGVRGRLI